MTPPTLAPGDRFGAYEVVELVGAGGMGEVYRARDTRLSRDVALKVLPDRRRLDPQRRARFEREAQLLSSLNHPNIATLHSVEESNESTALVMELVEGDTLADMLSSGGRRGTAEAGDRGRPLPVRKALDVAGQIAAALASAHDRGIIHRDLKPANIKVRPDGTVKVLDFGLAKIDADDIPGDTTAATLTASGTAGVVVGTAAYMSPEQARGLPIDRRTDVWAFGCVLYEMLTGRKAFGGATTSDALAAILTTEPDFMTLPSSVPSSVEALLRRCLAKEAQDRLRDIGDARLEIAEALAAPGERRRRVGAGRHWRTAAALALVAATSAAAAWIAAGFRPDAPAAVIDVPLALPEAPIIPWQPVPVQLSADGSRFLYHSVLGMAVADTRDYGIVVLEGTRSNDPRSSAARSNDVVLSPDGRSVAYFEADRLNRVPVTGGRPVTLASGIGPGRTASWTRHGFILVATDRGLFRVSEEQGGLEQIPVQRLESDEQIYYPELLPDGRHVLCTIAKGGPQVVSFNAAAASDARVEVIDLESGARKTLVNPGGFAHFLPSGHLVYLLRGGLHARRFDPDRLEPGGDDVRVMPDVAQFSVSHNGTLLYVAAGRDAPRSPLVWANRGNADEQSLEVDPLRVVYPRLSPSGRHIAIVGDAHGSRDILLWDIDAKRLTPVTKDLTDDQLVVWKDDDHIVFSSSRFGSANMFLQAVDATGQPQRVLESANDQMPVAVDSAGRLLFAERSRTRSFDLFVLDWTTRRSVPLLQTDAIEANPMVSPDGKWLAYQSNESGQFEVYVRPYAGPAGRPKVISRGGGTQPLFSRNGSELFYRDFFGAVWAVPVPVFDRPTKILDARDYNGKGSALQARTYDVAPDGRFLMIQQPRQDLVLVVNWVERLKKLLPSR